MHANRLLTGFFLSFFIASTTSADSDPLSSFDKRLQTPHALDQFYVGAGEGIVDLPFSNRQLSNGIQVISVNTEIYSPYIFIGHYFNPYLAVEMSMLGRVTVVVHPVSDDKKNIHQSIFGLSLRPMLPISQRFGLYALLGVGTISRSGFSVNHVSAISTDNLVTLLAGGGISIGLTPYWKLVTGVEYAPARHDHDHQPSMTFVYGGFYYLFHHMALPNDYSTPYLFQQHLVQLGGFSTSIFDPDDYNKYFSASDSWIPIFWSSSEGVRDGAWLRYENNVFHTKKMFSFYWGVSVSTYHSKDYNESIQAFSVFPLIRLWFIRSDDIDLYFNYSAAGPTFLTRHDIDHRDLGSNFIFQDMMGLGAVLGKNKQVDLNVGMGHYSNGNLFPRNPGFDIPITISLGYAFSS